MSLHPQPLNLKRAEFADLFAAFVNGYLSSDEGRAHRTAYTRARSRAQESWAAILAAAERGEDVTEAVLFRLLPYADTEANRAADRWVHVAPAFASDVRVKYEAAGWTEPEDWPRVADALLTFVRRCVEAPHELADACAEFAALPYTKGFQAGTLSPILNALRPEDFVVINAKSRLVVNYFAGTAYRQTLADYPDANATALALIDARRAEMHTLDVTDASDGDLFDMFCHWLVSVRAYAFEGPEMADDASLAAPFGEIFAGPEEADWALDLVRMTLHRLGVTGPDDPRFALTLPHDGRTLRLTFGNWTVLQISGPCYAQFRVGLALLGAHPDVVGPYDPWRPFVTDDDVMVRVYELPMQTVNPLRGDLRRAYERALDYIATRFADWQAGSYRRFNRPAIAAAVFDPTLRDALFGEPEALPTPAVREGTTSYAAPPEPVVNPPYPLERCAADTGFAAATLARWVRAIARKGQAVFYGPPGTGKTFLAERLARHLVGGGDGFWQLVQFHPAYAYEDFIQGIRPRTRASGGLAYPREPGRFLRFCAEARRCEGTCVLIIDEINRADLPRVFGEVMYLLEYRDRAIPLAGGGTFSIPGNVRILGTMNTADRSIALVDHALRRRFAFIAVTPNYAALRRYHEGAGASSARVEALIAVLRRLNAQIGDPHYHVGITYFLHPELDRHLADIWRMEIEPYLEEYFFDRPEQARAFAWEAVREALEVEA
jgi:5-methylcytosine-specific restriction protein B